MSSVIRVENITKIFPNGIVANRDITLYVNAGEIVGIVGPNGAGKTTLIRQILGLLKSTKGKISILGEDSANSKKVKYIGYVPQYPLFFPSLTVKEVIEFMLRFNNMKEYDRISETILETVGLGDSRNMAGYQLSAGQRKLLLFAMAISKNPQILILDEPTSMVDLVHKKIIWDIIENFNGEGVLIASHDMNEVRKLCDRIYLLVDGRIIAKGTPEEISSIIEMPVEISFTVKKSKSAEKLLTEKNIEYEKRFNVFSISFQNIDHCINFVKVLNDIAGITSLHVDAPSFEKAVYKLLKEVS